MTKDDSENITQLEKDIIYYSQLANIFRANYNYHLDIAYRNILNKKIKELENILTKGLE